MIKDNRGINDVPFWTPASEEYRRYHEAALHRVARKLADRAQYIEEDIRCAHEWIFSPIKDTMEWLPAATPPVTPIRGCDSGYAAKAHSELTYSTAVTPWIGGMLWNFGSVPISPYDDVINYIRDTIGTIDYHQYIDDPTTTGHLDLFNWELV